MCLILFGIEPDHKHRLVIAANRDELYARPTAQAHFWEGPEGILGGKDLEAGGTWLGVTTTGRFAAVTNFREDPPDPLPPRSRGELTVNFLRSGASPWHYLNTVSEEGDEYRGFNLIVGDGQTACYYSNREGVVRRLSPGFYGLSNRLLDCDWPKVSRGRKQLSKMSEAGFPTDSLFDMLFCRGDGEPFSQSFIATERYGTSASTVVKIEQSGLVHFEERNFTAMGEPDKIHRYSFNIPQES